MQLEELSNITNIPFDNFVQEGISQKNRIVKEVMDALFAQLPPKGIHLDEHSFRLSGGTKCWIKAFSKPKTREDKDNWQYGFDVVFEDGFPLVHLEFSVACTGWERALWETDQGTPAS